VKFVSKEQIELLRVAVHDVSYIHILLIFYYKGLICNINLSQPN